MSNIDKQALLGADKHANQHRLSRLIIEANSAELRDIAEAVEQYTDQLIAALADSEKHIAELESKNGNLRTIAHEQNGLAIRANLDSNNDAVEMDRLQTGTGSSLKSSSRFIMLEAELIWRGSMQHGALTFWFTWRHTDVRSLS